MFSNGAALFAAPRSFRSWAPNRVISGVAWCSPPHYLEAQVALLLQELGPSVLFLPELLLEESQCGLLVAMWHCWKVPLHHLYRYCWLQELQLWLPDSALKQAPTAGFRLLPSAPMSPPSLQYFTFRIFDLVLFSCMFRIFSLYERGQGHKHVLFFACGKK